MRLCWRLNPKPWLETSLVKRKERKEEKGTLGHRSLCYRCLVFYGFQERFLLGSGDNKPGERIHLSGAQRKWVRLWNIESAKRFKPCQHPAVPLQFNTEGLRQADSRDGSSNLRETLERTHKDNWACTPREFPRLVYGGGTEIMPDDQERQQLFLVGFDHCNLFLFLDWIVKYVLSCVFLVLFTCRW